ncbi:MAG: hypothetical protein AAFW46_16500 [Pseudomonadota bacterium]
MSDDHAAGAARRPWWTISGLLERTRAYRNGVRGVMRVIGEMRAPFIASLLGVIAFAMPGQITEVYHLLAEDFEFSDGFTPENLRFAIFLGLLWLTCYILWYIGRTLTLLDLADTGALDQQGATGSIARWAPRLIGAAPAFAAAGGLFYAGAAGSEDADAEGLYAAAAIALLIGLMRIWLSWRRTRGGREMADRRSEFWFSAWTRLTFGAALIGFVFYLFTNPIAVLQILGPLSIICIFLIALAYGLAWLTYVNDSTGIPALGLLVGAALLFSALDWNDNHYVRQLPPASQDFADGSETMSFEEAEEMVRLASARASISTAFDAWLAARPTRDAYVEAGKQYPVYVVAAQGGGLYAAHQSATFLARLQDACPSFADHVFAISGVSGGSVGATVFTALAKAADERERNGVSPALGDDDAGPDRPDDVDLAACVEQAADHDQIEPKVKAIFERDFLTPLLSATLFGDFTARFSPEPIPQLSRALALEQAFEAAWRDVEPEAPELIETGLLNYWRPDGSAPVLLLNSTEVDTGLRVVISPIQDLGAGLRSYAEVAKPDEFGQVPDLRLSTAMVLSARFPYITPAGSLDVVQQLADGGVTVRKARLVDGAYFENSGIDTATDVLENLRQVLRERRRAISRARQRGEAIPNDAAIDADIRLIVFDLTSSNAEEPSYALSELLTPIQAILNARTSRSELAQLRARRALFADCRYLLGPDDSSFGDPREQCLKRDLSKSRVWSVSLDADAYEFALGWILSSSTLRQIERQLGTPAACKVDDARELRQAEQELNARYGEKDAQRQEAAAARREAEGREVDEAEPVVDSIAVHNSCIGEFIVRQLEGDGANLRRSRTAQSTAQ